MGALNSPRGYVYAPTEKIIGGNTALDLTPPKPKPPPANGRRLMASVEEVAAADAAADAAAAAAAAGAAKSEDASSKKLVVSDDPLDLSKDFPLDYRNWAAVLSQVCVSFLLLFFSSQKHKTFFCLFVAHFFFPRPCDSTHKTPPTHRC